MSLCLCVDMKGVDATIGYGSFPRFKYRLIVACQGQGDAETYNTWREDYLFRHIDRPLPDCFKGALRALLIHSDCEGTFTPRQSASLLRLMEKHYEDYRRSIADFDEKAFFLDYYVRVMAVLGVAVMKKKEVRFT